MTPPPLLEQVLALPLEERLTLAEALWQSIDADLPATDDHAAIAQATRRDADMNAGAVTCRSHADVMHTARRAIGCN